MVTDKQNKQNKTNKKGKLKEDYWRSKSSSANICRAWPQARKITTEDLFPRAKLRQVFDFDFLAKPFFKSLLAPSSWDRVDDPQLAEVVLKPTYCWSCYVADVRERAADQITK